MDNSGKLLYCYRKSSDRSRHDYCYRNHTGELNMCWFRRKHKPKTMTQLQWLYSYEVFLVDTASGNLELGTYTLSELESNYWIYDPSKDPPHLTARPFPVKPN